MKALLITAIVVVALIAIILPMVKGRVVPTHRVTVADIPRVLAQLSASTSDPTFAVFMFNTPDQPGEEDALNIQFSVENQRPGLDWVLLGNRNLQDEERFVQFARRAGYELEKKEMNAVRYQRVENGDIAGLCSEVITKLYGLSSQDPIGLITEGFEWTP